MKKLFAVAFLMSATLVACGGKAKTPVTPDNKATGATGGTTYGDGKGSAMPAPAPGGGGAPTTSSDPCAGGQ